MHEQLTTWHCFLGSVLFPGNVLGVVVSSSICMCRVGVVKHKIDHLACFIPAMLALGAHAGAVKEEKAKRYMQARSHFDVTFVLLLCADRVLHVHLRRDASEAGKGRRSDAAADEVLATLMYAAVCVAKACLPG